MAAARRADVTWEGDLLTGGGVVTAGTSRAFNALPVTWASRTESPQGKTSPEELIAAAHAGCFTMALSAQLGTLNFTPQSLRTTATLSLEKLDAGWTISKIHLDLAARIPGISKEAFDSAAASAKSNCPVSRLLKAEITLTASLEQAA